MIILPGSTRRHYSARWRRVSTDRLFRTKGATRKILLRIPMKEGIKSLMAREGTEASE